MSTAIVKKSTLTGIVQAPSSKSVAHRMMICAALSRTNCILKNVSSSDDMDATIGCLESLGAKFKKDGTTLFVDATNFVKAADAQGHYTLDCKESGTTLRIMIPICASLGLNVTFTGHGRLPNRPLDEYVRILPKHGVTLKFGDNFLPLTISGKLKGECFCVSPKVSSQYVSGLIFALSLLSNDSVLKLESELVGGQYVDITTSVMSKFSVMVTKQSDQFVIKGMQKYRIEENSSINVEGDWSQAAFFLCAGAINGDITVTNLDINSNQGDKKIVEFLQAFGANITVNANSVTVKKSNLHGTDIDATDTPDLVPILAVLSSYAKGVTNIYGVERLKFKESDRLLSTADMINSLGGCATYTDSCMTITGQQHLNGGNVNGYNDHRIVMSAAVAGLNTQNDTIIDDAQAINKSYSDFFADYSQLGGNANVIMG